MSEDLIDLNKRTQKELLLEVHQTVKTLSVRFEKIEKKYSEHDIALATIKSQMRSFSIVWGSVSAIIVSVLVKLLS